jgi:aspartate dehydrogenase
MPGLPAETRVAVAGLGSIGAEVVKALDRGIEGLTLTAVASQNPDKHRAWLAELKSAPKVLPIGELADAADIVVECAPMAIENIPAENPRAGRITALSVIACLRKQRASLRIGT